jgi:hypothetical protein
MLFLGLGKEFLQFCVFLLDFQVILLNPWKKFLLSLLKRLKDCYKQ